MYTHRIIVLLVSSIFLFISCNSSGSSLETASVVPRVDPSVALKGAAKLYKNRDDLDNIRKAISVLGKARNPDKRNYEIEWTYARYCYFLGSRKNIEDEESEKVLDKGIKAARIASRMEPNKPDGLFWQGAILGEQSKRSPVTVGTISVGKIRKIMTRVVEIDPTYEGASPYDALGQLELSTRGLAGGSPKKAVEYFQKAMNINSENSYIRLHLAEAHLALNQDSDAKKHLDFILSMKPHPDFIPEYEETLAVAKKLLRDKF